MEDLAFLKVLQCFDQAWQAFTLKTERERNLLPDEQATFMNAVKVQSLFGFMKNVDATVRDVEAAAFAIQPKALQRAAPDHPQPASSEWRWRTA